MMSKLKFVAVLFSAFSALSAAAAPVDLVCSQPIERTGYTRVVFFGYSGAYFAVCEVRDMSELSQQFAFDNYCAVSALSIMSTSRVNNEHTVTGMTFLPIKNEMRADVRVTLEYTESRGSTFEAQMMLSNGDLSPKLKWRLPLRSDIYTCKKRLS